MVKQIVDVTFDDGSISICRILEDLNDDEYLIEEFICKRNGTCKYSGITQVVCKDSVCGYYDVENIEDTGLYRKISDNLYEVVDESDEDHEESSEEEESDSDISLDDEE